MDEAIKWSVYKIAGSLLDEAQQAVSAVEVAPEEGEVALPEAAAPPPVQVELSKLTQHPKTQQLGASETTVVRFLRESRDFLVSSDGVYLSRRPREKRTGPPPARRAGFKRSSRSLYVGNLSYAVTEELLYELFVQAGPISDLVLVTDSNTGASKGFAFVEYDDDVSAEYAIKLLDGIFLLNRPLRVRKSEQDGPQPQSEQTPLSSLADRNATVVDGSKDAPAYGQRSAHFHERQASLSGLPSYSYGDAYRQAAHPSSQYYDQRYQPHAPFHPSQQAPSYLQTERGHTRPDNDQRQHQYSQSLLPPPPHALSTSQAPSFHSFPNQREHDNLFTFRLEPTLPPPASSAGHGSMLSSSGPPQSSGETLTRHPGSLLQGHYVTTSDEATLAHHRSVPESQPSHHFVFGARNDHGYPAPARYAPAPGSSFHDSYLSGAQAPSSSGAYMDHNRPLYAADRRSADYSSSNSHHAPFPPPSRPAPPGVPQHLLPPPAPFTYDIRRH